MGYGAGLLGLVAIKVLAPGFYASQDIKTPVSLKKVTQPCKGCIIKYKTEKIIA